MNIIAIVPVKYESTRVPGKNFRIMNGKPLYYWIFNTLSNSNVNKIICNTDSEYVSELINKDFPEVEIYFRLKHLEGGHISTNLLLLDTIQNLNLTDPKYVFLQTHVTNPLLSVETINKCIDAYHMEKCDSLFTVKQLQTRLYNKKYKAINHNPKELIPTQDLDPIYEENSCLYLFPYKVLNKYKHRIGKKPHLFVMDDIESSDIDYESDFILTEQLMKMRKDKATKVVVITGSSGGIGDVIVKKFKKKGWIVVGIDIQESDNVDLFFDINLSLETEYKKYIDEIIKQYGRIDCLVNNAALQICKSWKDYNEEDWIDTMNVNVKSCWRLSEACREYLSENKGSIINICSIHCLMTSENIGLYAVSKSALQGLTKSMSLEYIKDGVRVNCILPGAIDTPMLRAGIERQSDPELALEKLEESCPCGKIGSGKDIAKAVYYLSKSDFSVGSSLVIDGGVSVKLGSE